MKPAIQDKNDLLVACKRWLSLHGEIGRLTLEAAKLSSDILAATDVAEGGPVDCYWPLIVGNFRIDYSPKGQLTLDRCERLD